MKEEHVKEDQALQALRALAECDRYKEAPPEVEARLLGAFRSRRRPGRRWAAIAALATGLLITLLLWPNRTPEPSASGMPPGLQAPETAKSSPAVVPATKVARTPHKLARKVTAVEQPQPHEVVTDFFPLMNPAPSFERGQMLRVQLPAAAMQTVGLPVREEHLHDLVQADVLVGEEGMPRAIRFVRFDVK
jgi:hypothetical protein